MKFGILAENWPVQLSWIMQVAKETYESNNLQKSYHSSSSVTTFNEFLCQIRGSSNINDAFKKAS